MLYYNHTNDVYEFKRSDMDIDRMIDEFKSDEENYPKDIVDNLKPQEVELEWGAIVDDRRGATILGVILRKTIWRDSDKLFAFVRRSFTGYLNKYGDREISGLTELMPLHDEVCGFLAEVFDEANQIERPSDRELHDTG